MTTDHEKHSQHDFIIGSSRVGLRFDHPISRIELRKIIPIIVASLMYEIYPTRKVRK